ncbi:hypothetical protein C8Q76DRAFT_467587 [Earliella scabrosa]|nr:hypothetical protein C8Q76DRAFT_467587 [Earliella scabrosa]
MRCYIGLPWPVVCCITQAVCLALSRTGRGNLYVSDSIPRQCLEFEVSMLHCLTQIRMRSRLITLALTMTTTQCELLKAGDSGMTRDPRACRG